MLTTASGQLLAIAHAQENGSNRVATATDGSKSITLNNGTREAFDKLVFPSTVRRIYLRNCDMDDASLMRLEGLKQLEYLSLEGSKIHGDGLIVLRSMPALKFLCLSGTKISDESLQHLIGSKIPSILLRLSTKSFSAISFSNLSYDQRLSSR